MLTNFYGACFLFVCFLFVCFCLSVFVFFVCLCLFLFVYVCFCCLFLLFVCLFVGLFFSTETNLAPELQASLSLVKDKEGKIYLQHPEALKLAYLGTSDLHETEVALNW